MRATNNVSRTAFAFTWLHYRLFFASICFILLVVLPLSIYSQISNFSISKIPITDPEINSSGRGALFWNGVVWDNQAAPLVPEGVDKGRNAYRRFNWFEMEQGQGVYTFTGGYPSFEFWIKLLINRGESFGFGIMPVCEGCDAAMDGGRGSYPLYLHNLMQAEEVNSRDWKTSGGMWIPNWNSPNYLSRLEALMNALSQFIQNGSYVAQSGPNAGKTVRYRDVIDYVDIRGFGNFGEWHNYPYHNEQPAGRMATSATLKRIIDIHKNAFPDKQLILVDGVFEDGPASFIPLEVTHYALTTSNNFGKLGWRRDNMGEKGEDNRLSLNTSVYNGYRFDTAIVNRWKYAMITGEPINGGGQYANGGPPYYDLRREINLYHFAHFGNGNYPYNDVANPAVRDTIREAFKLTGYRFYLNGGSVNSLLTPGQPFRIFLQWQNKGVAPIYEKHWQVTYQLRNASKAAVWSGISSFNPYLFLPGEATVIDDFILPLNIPVGDYSLSVTVKDSTGYRPPLTLAIYGRANDGSYVLANGLTVGTPPPNQPPVADAGPDQRLLLPQTSTELTGMGTDPENGTLGYQWSLLSGPSGSIIRTPAQRNTIIEGLRDGSYYFEFKVTDASGDSDADTVLVFVNDPPSVSAGPDQTITLPDNIITLTSTATDNDGTVVAYNWLQISGPTAALVVSPTMASTSVRSLSEGDYFFSVTVTDNASANASDTVRVRVNRLPNKAPIANAGADQTITLPINTVQLSAANSTDADGTIVQYAWTVLSGPDLFHFDNANASSTTFFDLVQGAYLLKLTVTDNEGAATTDTVLINVYPDPNNMAPNANAGSDRQIILPVDSILLDARLSNDPDGVILNYFWIKAEGPEIYHIVSPHSVETQVNHLIAGRYIFLLIVTDNQGSSSTDSVIVNVLPDPSNLVPVANAGTDTVITLPVNNLLLSSLRSEDPDGQIVRAEWRQVFGPHTALYGTVNSDTVVVSQLVKGTYRFALTVIDNSGAAGMDSIEVIVNIPPAAAAGNDQVIHYPANTVQLDGDASADSDGIIRDFQWDWVSGPTQYQLTNANRSKANLSGLSIGVYRFSLRVTDNWGAIGKDTLSITVNEQPAANAGPDIVLTLPANITVLDGNASTDPDGTIRSYHWSFLSGPATYRLVNPLNPATILSELIQGVYSFSLTVTDQFGATSIDTVRITVNKAPNKMPVANAGSDFAVFLPDPYLQLNGSGSYDPDGIIVSYHWKLVNGPSVVTFSDTASSISVISGVRAGVYRFQLTVMDNEGAIATTQLSVTVNPPLNKLPIAKAGRDTTIVFPFSRVNLNGNGSYDPDGSITGYQWRQLSGPSGASLQETARAIAKAFDLTEGVYLFELTVTDNSGALGKDTVRVTVINTMRAAEFIHLYPNPATQAIRLQFQVDAQSTGNITVFDQHGHVLQSHLFRSDPGIYQRQFNIASLRPGVYYLEVMVASQKRVVRPFIKQ